MTPEIEDRLRAALRARAEQVTADKLSPAKLPPAPPRRTGRWLVPMLVAAAGLAAVVAGGVVAPRLSTSPAPPATQPPVTPPAPTSTVAGPSSAPVKPGTGSPAGQSGGAGGTTAVEFDGVRLTVPAGWHLLTLHGSGDPVGCLLQAGVARPTDERGCALAVRTPRLGVLGANLVAADAIGGFRDRRPDPLCPDGFKDTKPGEHRDISIDGRTAAYRTIIVDCTLNDYVVQQWVVADNPGVVMVRWHGGRSGADDATVRDAVSHASLPAGTGLPLVDFGHLTGYSVGTNGITLTFDRVVPRSLWSPRDVNDNPQTYQLRLDPEVVVRSATSLCAPSVLSADPVGLGARHCVINDLLARLADGSTSPARAAFVWVQYDRDGRVGYITEEFRA